MKDLKNPAPVAGSPSVMAVPVGQGESGVSGRTAGEGYEE